MYINECGERTVEKLVDGMCTLLRKNFAAATPLTVDASIGGTLLDVEDSLRFNNGDQVVIFDDTCVWDDDTQRYIGVEYHTVKHVAGTTLMSIALPLKKTFLVNKKAKIQRALKNSFLWPKDVLYGDRETVNWDNVAICVEPDSRATSWLAINGLSSDEWRMSILVYIKMASAGEDISAEVEESAMRTCNAYCDAIHRLLINNIHLDIGIDDIPLMRDAQPGDDFVWVPSSQISEWPPDNRTIYDIQDNFQAEWCYSLPSLDSSSSTSTSSFSTLTEVVSSSSSKSSSTLALGPSSSSSSFSTQSSVGPQSSGASSSSSSESSYGPMTKLYLSGPVHQHYRVSDKAVVRRHRRYMYDSLPADATYGVVQKGQYLIKAGKVSWTGKETNVINFPQIGRGNKTY